MPIKIQTPNSSIVAHFEQEFDAHVRQPIINVLQYVGEAFIREARLNGNYMDQTGNLRSSIGYAVVVDGTIVHDGYVQQTKEGTEGQSASKKFLTSVAKEYQGLSLIGVAGMKYAVYVMSMGYNVITSAELLADHLVPQMLNRLGFTKK